MPSAVKIDVGKLPLKVARNFVIIERLIITNQMGIKLLEDGEQSREPIQNGVIRGLGPLAYREGYRRGNHVLFRLAAATEFKFLGDKFLLIFSSEIISVKLDGPARDHGEKKEEITTTSCGTCDGVRAFVNGIRDQNRNEDSCPHL